MWIRSQDGTILMDCDSFAVEDHSGKYEGVHMINKIKLFFKRLFCKHEFTWCVKNEMFHCISGETQYLVCLKCGKVKDTRYIKFD